MSYKKSELYFLSALLVGVSLIAFFIFQPFLAALILAVIFATTFAPVHKRVLSLTHQNRGLAALLTTAFVLIVIVVPVTFLSMQIFREATQLYSSLIENGGMAGISQVIKEAVRSLGIPFLSADSLDLGLYMKQALSFLIQNLGTVFSNIAKIMVDIFVLLVALYYFFKDGSNLKKSVVSLSPLQDIYDEAVFHKLEIAINGVVRGSIAVGLMQGTLTAVGFTIFGIPNPVLWGSIAAVASLIPGLGTSLVLIPGILFLFFTGATASAAGLMIWALFAVGLVDNILGPKLVGHGAKLHHFLVLLSVLGGVVLFGPLGFLFGPLALSLFFAFLEIYSNIRREEG